MCNSEAFINDGSRSARGVKICISGLSDHSSAHIRHCRLPHILLTGLLITYSNYKNNGTTSRACHHVLRRLTGIFTWTRWHHSSFWKYRVSPSINFNFGLFRKYLKDLQFFERLQTKSERQHSNFDQKLFEKI
jgi:hypothetical protein